MASILKSHSLILSLYQIGAVRFGDFTLKSGQSSNIYLDLRQIISYPALLRTVAQAIWDKIQKCEFELLCGVPYTALPIATCLSLEHNLPMVLRRKEKKDYGTKKIIEGAYQAGQRCLIIEDIITTGSSILETADDLEAAGLKVTDAIVLINREQSGKENLGNRGYVLHAAFTLKEILQTLLRSAPLPAEEQNIVATLLQEQA